MKVWLSIVLFALVAGGARPLVLAFAGAEAGVGRRDHLVVGALLGLGAALRHHFVLKDDVLRRMI